MIKKGIISFIFILLYTLCSAQIGNVIVERSFAKIYNKDGYYTGRWIGLTSNAVVVGFNNQYIAVSKNSNVYIYNHEGLYTGGRLSLCNGCVVYRVTQSNIIVLENGSKLSYYDFMGKYTGKFTYL